jgi:hypothetical protein
MRPETQKRCASERCADQGVLIRKSFCPPALPAASQPGKPLDNFGDAEKQQARSGLKYRFHFYVSLSENSNHKKKGGEHYAPALSFCDQ